MSPGIRARKTRHDRSIPEVGNRVRPKTAALYHVWNLFERRGNSLLMANPNTAPSRPITLPSSAGGRLFAASSRALRRHCPYCGASGIFDGWFTLKERCPACNTLYAYEDGYFLGSYAVNLISTELLTVAIVIWMIAGTDMSVLQMQLYGISLAVALPLVFYPIAVLLWVALDLTVHPPGDMSDRPRR